METEYTLELKGAGMFVKLGLLNFQQDFTILYFMITWLFLKILMVKKYIIQCSHLFNVFTRGNTAC